MLKHLMDHSEENLQIYFDIFLVGHKYAELCYGGDKPKQDSVSGALKELMDKLAKVAIAKKTVKDDLFGLEQDLLKRNLQGVDAVATHALGGAIENFLSQAKGALDIFGNQLLPEIIGYKGKWNHKEILKHLRETKDLDQSMVNEIEKFLKNDWLIWLESFLQDRNLHHEANFKLSDMYIENGKPVVTLERHDGTKTRDINNYIEVQWNNLIGMISDLIALIFSAKVPAFKAFRITRNMFISDAELAKIKESY